MSGWRLYLHLEGHSVEVRFHLNEARDIVTSAIKVFGHHTRGALYNEIMKG